MLNPLPGMLVIVTVEGIPIGNATTDSDGNYSFNWQVPNIFADGNHTVQADVPAQGWYRAGVVMQHFPSTPYRHNCQYC